MLKLLLVDDFPIMLQGVRRFLEAAFGPVVIGEAADGEEAWQQLRATTWDLVLLDISLPDKTGLALLREWKQEWPDLRVLMLSMHVSPAYVTRAISAGAAGYLTKESATEELATAIAAILAGGTYLGKSVRWLAGSAAQAPATAET
jgi:DNA-binding NarL/FixJ family response regulator